MTATTFNRATIAGHVDLIHDFATGCEGILILAAFEETGPGRRQKFRIGDTAGMTDAIMAFENHPAVNLYLPWCVMRGDLEIGKKGSEKDITAVLAAVGDLDNDKYQLADVPIDAS